MSSFILHSSALIPTPRVRTLHTSSVALPHFYVNLRARLDANVSRKCTCAPLLSRSFHARKNNSTVSRIVCSVSIRNRSMATSPSGRAVDRGFLQGTIFLSNSLTEWYQSQCLNLLENRASRVPLEAHPGESLPRGRNCVEVSPKTREGGGMRT